MDKSKYSWALIAAVILISFQILGMVIYVYSFIPFPAYWQDVFSKGVEPKRDTLFFGIFLTLSFVLMVMGVKWVLPKLNNLEGWYHFKRWMIIESIWTFLIMFCFFKWITYQYPFWNILPYANAGWLIPFFWSVCVGSLLSKIFYPEIERLLDVLKVKISQEMIPPWVVFLFQLFFILSITVILYIPHLEDVSALALAWDQWNHLDNLVAWFINRGWHLDYDTIIGGVILTAIGYLIALFYFIRFWLKSWLLAAIGTLLVIKLGIFYYAAAPCAWINPSNTFLGQWWDIGVFWVLVIVADRYPRQLTRWGVILAGVLISNYFQSGGYLELLGLDNQPLMAPLRVRQFFPYFMAYVVPVFYVLSLLVMTGHIKEQQWRLPICLCVYGLMIFINYLMHPAIGYYGVLMVPAILIMLWWLKQFLFLLSLYQQRIFTLVVLVIVILALMTNRLMSVYPNIIFQDKNRFAQESNQLHHFDDLAISAGLIQRLTSSEEKIPLISNFEVALLMKAERKSLFDNFPIMFSSLNGPGGLKLKTKDQCMALVSKLTEENARYLFVDTRLLNLDPKILEGTGLAFILNYIKEHYQFSERAGFLTAFQRK